VHRAQPVPGGGLGCSGAGDPAGAELVNFDRLIGKAVDGEAEKSGFFLRRDGEFKPPPIRPVKAGIGDLEPVEGDIVGPGGIEFIDQGECVILGAQGSGQQADDLLALQIDDALPFTAAARGEAVIQKDRRLMGLGVGCRQSGEHDPHLDGQEGTGVWIAQGEGIAAFVAGSKAAVIEPMVAEGIGHRNIIKGGEVIVLLHMHRLKKGIGDARGAGGGAFAVLLLHPDSRLTLPVEPVDIAPAERVLIEVRRGRRGLSAQAGTVEFNALTGIQLTVVTAVEEKGDRGSAAAQSQPGHIDIEQIDPRLAQVSTGDPVPARLIDGESDAAGRGKGALIAAADARQRRRGRHLNSA